MARLRADRIVVFLLILAPTRGIGAADTPPPPQGVWFGKGQFGFLNSHGNSDSQSTNGNIDVQRYDGAWKNEFYLSGLYGKNSGIVSAERWEGHGQSNYTLSGNLFAAPLKKLDTVATVNLVFAF